jgi:hypothetical protein
VIAISNDLPGDSTAGVIIRRHDVTPHDVILVRDDIDRQRLSDVLIELLTVRRVTGDTAVRSGAVRIQPQDGNRVVHRKVLPWTERVVQDLRRASPQDIPGIGTLPAVEIWLPPQHGPTQVDAAAPPREGGH